MSSYLVGSLGLWQIIRSRLGWIIQQLLENNSSSKQENVNEAAP
jgi:hypothetical protein